MRGFFVFLALFCWLSRGAVNQIFYTRDRSPKIRGGGYEMDTLGLFSFAPKESRVIAERYAFVAEVAPAVAREASAKPRQEPPSERSERDEGSTGWIKSKQM